jgi:translation elongation factor EF-Ts
MNGRIEYYIHSDSITKAKGGSLVKVLSDTESGARTQEFQDFCKLVASRAYAAQASDWAGVRDVFPDLEDQRLQLSKLLKEKVDIESIAILAL